LDDELSIISSLRCCVSRVKELFSLPCLLGSQRFSIYVDVTRPKLFLDPALRALFQGTPILVCPKTYDFLTPWETAFLVRYPRLPLVLKPPQELHCRSPGSAFSARMSKHPGSQLDSFPPRMNINFLRLLFSPRVVLSTHTPFQDKVPLPLPRAPRSAVMVLKDTPLSTWAAPGFNYVLFTTLRKLPHTATPHFAEGFVDQNERPRHYRQCCYPFFFSPSRFETNRLRSPFVSEVLAIGFPGKRL